VKPPRPDPKAALRKAARREARKHFQVSVPDGPAERKAPALKTGAWR
jgi:hypothetical protein